MATYTPGRVDDPASPDRCQGSGPHGNQCMLKKVPGSDYCPAHGGNMKVNKEAKEGLRNYKIEQARMRMDLNDKLNSSGLISLRDEVALSRYLLEQILNRVDNENDLILQHSAISDLLDKISKIVSACHKLELSTNSVMDEKQLIALAGAIVSVITTTIDATQSLSEEERSRLKGTLASNIIAEVKKVTNPAE
jgi:hypothetical protein